MVTTVTRITLASALALLATTAQAVKPIYGLQTGIENEDFEGDSETLYYLTGSALLSQGLSPNSIVNIQGELTLNEYSDNDDESGEEIFVEATYSYTPRAGYRVPTYSLGLRYEEEFTDDEDFESDETTLLVSVSYRLNDRTFVLGGLKYGERNANIDSDTTGIFFNLDYSLTQSWLVYTTLSFEEEEFTVGSSASSPRPATAGRSFIGGHHEDELIDTGGGGGGGGGGGRSRTVDFDNTIVKIGANYRINAHNFLDFSYEYAEYDASGGTDTGDTFSIDFFHRF